MSRARGGRSGHALPTCERPRPRPGQRVRSQGIHLAGESARPEGERRWPHAHVGLGTHIASTCPDLTVTLGGPREESGRTGAAVAGA